MLPKLQQKTSNIFLKPYLTWFLKKERNYRSHGFTMVNKPTVFHPNYFFSTSYLFDFVSRTELTNKKFLEIGCGSGLISLLAYQKNALVTCFDINSAAVNCTKKNFDLNFHKPSRAFLIYESDMFDNIPQETFDIIVVNPPYFFQDVTSNDQLAWNCGKNGSYFKKLFSQLSNYSNLQTNIFMILADNCEIERIKKIAESNQFSFELIEQKKIKWEMNYIYKIVKTTFK